MLRERSAFTLVEIIVVLAVVIGLSVAGFMSLGGLRGKQTIDSVLQETVSVIRDTQKRSISQESGVRWGIRLVGDPFDSHRYEVFSGVPYQSSAVQKKSGLRSSVRFTNPFASSTYDVLFDPISGRPTEAKVLSITNKRSDGFVGDIILRAIGSISSRLESGIVGYWHFDESASTTAYDSSGFGNNGSISGGPSWQSSTNCKAGSCLSFDGGNDKVLVSDSSSLGVTDSLTITAWIKRSLAADWQRVVGRYYWTGANTGSWLLYFNNASQTICNFNAGGSWTSVVSTATVNLNEWTFVACVYNGSSIINYLNSSSVSTPKTGTVAVTNYPLSIAVTSDGTNFQNYFNGSIDEIRIYNRALTAAEVLDRYNDLK